MFNDINVVKNFENDFSDINKFNDKIIDIYIDEFNDLFEFILIYSEENFIEILTSNVEKTLENEYNSEIFKNNKLNNLISDNENYIYENFYLPNFLILKESLSQTPKKLHFSFRKHCNYQNNNILHLCQSDEEEENEVTNDLFIIPKQNEDFIICSNCKKCYVKSCIKLFCSFCSKNFYTSFEIEETLNNDIQPATWQKYHCKLIYNCQMPCVNDNCDGKLFIDIKKNILLCKKCNLKSDPFNILWKCIKCNKNFTTGAKIYNPLEYKMMKNSIKNALLYKEFALPDFFPCSCDNSDVKFIRHKENCDGILYKSNFEGREMIICEKCHLMSFVKKYIWKCPKCGKRFRSSKEKKGEYSIMTNRIREYKNNYLGDSMCSEDWFNFGLFDKSTNESEIEKDKKNETKKSLNMSLNTFNSKDNDEDNEDEEKNNHKKSEDELINEKEENNDNNNLDEENDEEIENEEEEYEENEENEEKSIKTFKGIPEFYLEDYEILSQIKESTFSKIYVVKSIDSLTEFYCLKKIIYSTNSQFENIIDSLKTHYFLSTLSNNNILSLNSININESSKEINILLELGISSLDKEIYSRIKLKNYFKESEILSFLKQIISALSTLQEKGYSHFNLIPNNIIIFDNNIFKLNDFINIKSLYLDKNKINNKEEKYFIDPLQIQKISNDFIKSDIYCLGLITFYLSTLNMQNIKDLNSFFDNNNIIKSNIKAEEFIDQTIKEIYGEENKISDILSIMLNFNEKVRWDFYKLEKYVKNCLK